ncbi:MAG: hypothetical protein Q9187_000036 [Circinaria calcarea]
MSTLSEAYNEAQPLFDARVALHLLHGRSQLLMDASKDINSKYDSISQEISAITQLLELGQEWDGDGQKLLGILGLGRKASEEGIMDLLFGEDVAEIHAISKTSGSSKHRDVWTNFSTLASDNGDMGESWALVAQRTEKGVRRLRKYIE